MRWTVLLLLLILTGCSANETQVPVSFSHAMQECPTCDDANPCSKDYCSSATNFSCMHKPLDVCCGDGVCDLKNKESGCTQDCFTLGKLVLQRNEPNLFPPKLGDFFLKPYSNNDIKATKTSSYVYVMPGTDNRIVVEQSNSSILLETWVDDLPVDKKFPFEEKSYKCRFSRVASPKIDFSVTWTQYPNSSVYSKLANFRFGNVRSSAEFEQSREYDEKLLSTRILESSYYTDESFLTMDHTFLILLPEVNSIIQFDFIDSDMSKIKAEGIIEEYIAWLADNRTRLYLTKEVPEGVTTAPYLWKIESSKPAYLFGTIHVNDPRVLSVSQEIYKAINSVDNVFTELVNSGGDEDVDYLFREDGKPLRNLLPERVYRGLDAVMKEEGVSILSIEHVKIWILASMVEFHDSGNDPILDDYIISLAEKADKNVTALETDEDQREVFDKMTLQEQVQYLSEAVEYSVFGQDGREDTMKEYLNGSAREDIFNASTESEQAFIDRLTTERNRKMAEKIDLSLKSGQSFVVAVGVGHFLGENNIIDLLRQKGYKIERVPLSSECTGSSIRHGDGCYVPY